MFLCWTTVYLLRLPSCLMMAASVVLVTHSSSLVTPSGSAPRHKCRGSMFLFTNGMLVYTWRRHWDKERERGKLLCDSLETFIRFLLMFKYMTSSKWHLQSHTANSSPVVCRISSNISQYAVALYLNPPLGNTANITATSWQTRKKEGKLRKKNGLMFSCDCWWKRRCHVCRGAQSLITLLNVSAAGMSQEPNEPERSF